MGRTDTNLSQAPEAPSTQTATRGCEGAPWGIPLATITVIKGVHMSDDEKVAKDLVETLRDGEKGFASASEKLRDSDRAEWASVLLRDSEQRGEFAREIIGLGHAYGDDVDESGSAVAALHRGWLSVKDALTGDDAGGVLGAAVTGEDHSVSEYEKALEQDLSAGFREVVGRQHQAIVATRDQIKALHVAD